MHTSGKFGHPANWAGYMLMGKDIVLRDRSADLARSLRMMLQSPQDYLIATLKTLQAMVRERCGQEIEVFDKSVCLLKFSL